MLRIVMTFISIAACLAKLSIHVYLDRIHNKRYMLPNELMTHSKYLFPYTDQVDNKYSTLKRICNIAYFTCRVSFLLASIVLN